MLKGVSVVLSGFKDVLTWLVLVLSVVKQNFRFFFFVGFLSVLALEMDLKFYVTLLD